MVQGHELDAMSNGAHRSKAVRIEFNLSLPPSVPTGLRIVSDRPREGFFVWDPSAVRLYVDPEQKPYGKRDGRPIHARIVASKDVCGARLLDNLVDRQELIPDALKGCDVLFRGTVYEDIETGLECIRTLRYGGPKIGWNEGLQWLKLKSAHGPRNKTLVFARPSDR